MRGDRSRAAANAVELARLAREHDLPFGERTASFSRAWRGLNAARPQAGSMTCAAASNCCASRISCAFDGLIKIALAEAEARAGDVDRAARHPRRSAGDVRADRPSRLRSGAASRPRRNAAKARPSQSGAPKKRSRPPLPSRSSRARAASNCARRSRSPNSINRPPVPLKRTPSSRPRSKAFRRRRKCRRSLRRRPCWRSWKRANPSRPSCVAARRARSCMQATRSPR